MKIRSDSSNLVGTLQFSLKSTDTSFKLYTNPFPYADRQEFVQLALAHIEFADTYEIEALIDALQRFKTNNERYIGKWKKEV